MNCCSNRRCFGANDSESVNLSAGAALVVSSRSLHVSRQVDVLVIGGTTAAVAAAVAAAAAGKQVLLATPYPYLGEEYCATLQLQRCCLAAEAPAPLTDAIFGDAATTTPLRIKQTLTAAVVEAEVAPLLNTYPVGLVVDANNGVCGVVLADRSGRHVVLARQMIDCTRHYLLSQLKTATPALAAPRSLSLRRMIIGGEAASHAVDWRSVSAVGVAETPEVALYECCFAAELTDASPAGWAALAMLGRQRCRRRHQQRGAAELLYDVPPQAAELSYAAELGYVLGWMADEAAGRAAGAAAAGVAAVTALPELAQTRVLSPLQAVKPIAGLDLREASAPLFAAGADSAERVAAPSEAWPILANVDVLVCGGGTAGAAAAIAAARTGATVLVLEAQEALGGVGTMGLIGSAYHGRKVGFAAEVVFPGADCNLEDKMEWLRGNITENGGQIWFGAVATGAVVNENERVCGAAVATLWGHGVVLARVVIDGTGNADIAAAAGAATVSSADAADIAVQGTGLATRPLGKDSVNSDCLLVEDGNIVDETRALLGRTLALDWQRDYDVLPFIQSRERRRIVADHMLGYLDQLLGRTYADTIVHSQSDYDAHGYPSLRYFALLPHTEMSRKKLHPAPYAACDTPYRSLLPRDLDGLLVVGLGCGMHRDAAALVRMQLDLLNQGYAAGLAAATAARQDIPLRNIDIRSLQQHLVQMGALPQRVLTDSDNLDCLRAAVPSAISVFIDMSQSYECRSQALASIMRFAETAKPLLQECFARGDYSAEQRLELGKVLGFMGSAEGVELLGQALEVSRFDAKILQGGMAEYAHLPTPVDALILALGYSGSIEALPLLLRKLELLDAATTLSHHRSLALALEQFADPRAAQALATLLAKPGISGHAFSGIVPLVDKPVELRRREGALRELVLARALWRCGDWQNSAQRILEAYCRDWRGLLARHARLVLQAGMSAADTTVRVRNSQHR